jgi:hypothetical protein
MTESGRREFREANLFAHGTCRVGTAARLCEPRKPVAGKSRCPRARDQYATRAGGRPGTRFTTNDDGESVAFFDGRLGGLLLAWMMRNALPRLLTDSWAPPAFSAKFNWPIFAFAAAMSILTGIIFGLAPACQATRVKANSSLNNTGQMITHRRRGLTGKAIVILQVALSVLLVVGGGLFVRTLMQLRRTPLGFRSHNLLLFSVELPEKLYPATASNLLLQRIEEKLSSVPGVQHVTLTYVPLISGNAMHSTFVPEGKQRKPEGNPSVLANRVGAHFFETFGIAVVAGRGSGTSDRPRPIRAEAALHNPAVGQSSRTRAMVR